jgi:hypothetical protein
LTGFKYYRWYQGLINRARERDPRELDGYYERHHPCPRCFGADDKEVVPLTYQEHFLAHWLLVRMTKGLGTVHRSCQHALAEMRRSNKGKIIAGWQPHRP